MREKRLFVVAVASLCAAMLGSLAHGEGKNVFFNFADHFFWFVANLQFCFWMIKENSASKLPDVAGIKNNVDHARFEKQHA